MDYELKNVAEVLADIVINGYALTDVRLEGETVTFDFNGTRYCAVVEYDEG